MGSRPLTPTLAISAVNFTEGGPLTVLRECVRAAAELLPDEWRIIVFVNSRHLIEEPRVLLIEIPVAKTGWLPRLWTELVTFRTYSARIRPALWISLHDISPNVGKTPQVVYCHNPAPFFKLCFKDVYFEPTILAFRFAYSWVYRLNLRRNTAVVVQQSWLRDRFRRWTAPHTTLIVAHPTVAKAAAPPKAPSIPGAKRLIYPALPRVFKNFELLGRALTLLEMTEEWASEVMITVDGRENRYARWIKRKYGHLNSLKFIGRQTPAQMVAHYQGCDGLLFPSRLETWGLPISEAKQFGLPIFVADLPYARETVGNYHSVHFIDPQNHQALAAQLLSFQRGEFTFGTSRQADPSAPFAENWNSLIRILMECAHRGTRS